MRPILHWSYIKLLYIYIGIIIIIEQIYKVIIFKTHSKDHTNGITDAD